MQSVGSGEYTREKTNVVLTDPFWLSRHDVTQAHWEAVMGNNPAATVGSGHLPIDNVSYDAAVDFCKRLTLRKQKRKRLPEGYVYRLPTETEREYCCQAGDEESSWVRQAEDGP